MSELTVNEFIPRVRVDIAGDEGLVSASCDSCGWRSKYYEGKGGWGMAQREALAHVAYRTHVRTMP